MNTPACPVCPGHGILIGRLGSVCWYRCRYCGMDFNKKVNRRRPKKSRSRIAIAGSPI